MFYLVLFFLAYFSYLYVVDPPICWVPDLYVWSIVGFDFYSIYFLFHVVQLII